MAKYNAESARVNAEYFGREEMDCSMYPCENTNVGAFQ